MLVSIQNITAHARANTHTLAKTHSASAETTQTEKKKRRKKRTVTKQLPGTVHSTQGRRLAIQQRRHEFDLLRRRQRQKCLVQPCDKTRTRTVLTKCNVGEMAMQSVAYCGFRCLAHVELHVRGRQIVKILPQQFFYELGTFGIRS